MQIRPVTDPDIEAIEALISDRIEPEDGAEARFVLALPDFDRNRWTVAVESDDVLSTMATFPIAIRFGSTSIQAGMIEFVATATEHEGRGLVRQQFDVHHEAANTRGDLAQFITGIPYFYRRLGYEYPFMEPGFHAIDADTWNDIPDGWTCRVADVADLDAIRPLHAAVAATADSAVVADPHLAEILLVSPNYTTIVAEHDGEIQATVRVYEDDGDLYLLDLTCSSVEGATALIAAAGPNTERSIQSRPGIVPFVNDIAPHAASNYGLYMRIGDPTAFLNAVRNELNARLAASSLAGESGELLLSLYTSSIQMPFGPDGFGDAVAGPPITTGVIGRGGSGIPPDLFATMVFGRWSPTEMDGLFGDFNIGRQGAVLDALFPPQTVDVQTWIVP